MAMMAVPKNMVTMPRKRRPRASAGEVFITSESLIYLMDTKQRNSDSSQYGKGASDLQDIIYENVTLKQKPATANKCGYSCSIRTKDIIGNDTSRKDDENGCESQHVSIYIGKRDRWERKGQHFM